MRSISPDEVILGLLAKSPSHGYDLLSHFRQPERLGHVWRLSTSQLYTILRRLENNEDIEGVEVFSDDAPPRTDYWTTEQGHARFMAWLNAPEPSASTRHIRTAFISRLYLAYELRLPVGPIIDAQIGACRARLEGLQEKHDALPPGAGRLSMSLVISEMNSMLAWLGQCTAAWPAPTGDESTLMG
ncbi:MAG: PadR family transcriptional regulator [Anaerolineales bacterium]